MYTDFVRVGSHRFNLAQVSEVRDLGDRVRVFWAFAVTGDFEQIVVSCDDLKGDEAKLLLAYVDGDEEEIARLDSLVNAPQTSR